MPKTKISDYSSTANDNSDINSINIAEGCAPSNINDAIREMMAQLKNYQAGLSGDSVSAVGSVIVKGTSTTGADIQLYEDTDNGTNYVAFKAPSTIASNVTWTLPSADGTANQALVTDASGTLSFATFVTASGTVTLTNKRIDPRVTSTTTASSLTPSIATADQYAYTALASALTINAVTGTPTDGDKMIFRILDNGTSRTITFTGGVSGGFRPIGTNLTASGSDFTFATTVSKLTYFGCIYNANADRWDVVALTTQA